MSKVVLDDVISGYGLSKINENFQKIEDELNNKVLYRDNPVDEINTIEQDLDLNGFSLYNVEKINNVAVDTFTANVETVASSIDSVNTVATNIANVNIVAGIDEDVTDVAAVADDVALLAPYAPDVSAYATGIYNNLASEDVGKGAELVEYQGDTVEDALDVRLPEFANYAALDAYNGPVLSGVYVKGVVSPFDGGHGVFRPTTETPSSANGIYRQDALNRWWKREYSDEIHVGWFGLFQDGNDVTGAVVEAVNYANTFLLDGIVSTMKKPGATLVFHSGSYNLSSISSPINLLCNVVDNGATFNVPADYSGQVVVIGHTTPGISFTDAYISVPNIVKPTGSSLVAGSVGIRVANITESKVVCKQTYYFETGTWLGGIGEGTAANDIWLGHALYCKRAFVAIPGVNGWFNANRLYGGHVQQSTTYAGGVRSSGWRHLLIDGSAPASAVVGNTFIGPVLEGNASEYVIDVKSAYRNTFVGMYHESGAPTNAVTVSGDTITRSDHGLVVGDMLTFQASTSPSGMYLAVPYYVVSITSTSEFKVSLSKGGSPDTFGSAGSSVTYILCTRVRFDGSSSNTFGNRFFGTLTTASIAIDYIEEGFAIGNGDDSPFSVIRRAFVPEDFPVFRGANTSSAAGLSRPVFATYSPSVNPGTDPKNWSSALSDRGLAFSTNRAETGLISNLGGVLQYKRPVDSVAFEIASCRRAQSLIAITSLSCAANSMTYTTITLSGAAVNDHVVVTTASDLPAGLSFSHARVSAADTIRIGFFNHTASTIELSVNVNAMAVRRFF